MANESSTDRVLRLIAAIIFFFLATYSAGILQIILYIVAAILLITGITGFCLLYKLLGINTRRPS